MKIAIASMYNEDFKELAKLTHIGNKVKYAEKHGYPISVKTNGFSIEENINFSKMRLILDMFNTGIDWVFWLDADAMITNFDIKLESFIDNDYHFILTEDINGINAGSFFIRNSKEGREYFQHCLNDAPTYSRIEMYDNKWMWDTYEQYKPIIKVVQQNRFNSYNYKFYKHYSNRENWDDAYKNGNWNPGDFVIHWPGLHYNERLIQAKEMVSYVETMGQSTR